MPIEYKLSNLRPLVLKRPMAVESYELQYEDHPVEQGAAFKSLAMRALAEKFLQLDFHTADQETADGILGGLIYFSAGDLEKEDLFIENVFNSLKQFSLDDPRWKNASVMMAVFDRNGENHLKKWINEADNKNGVDIADRIKVANCLGYGLAKDHLIFESDQSRLFSEILESYGMWDEFCTSPDFNNVDNGEAVADFGMSSIIFLDAIFGTPFYGLYDHFTADALVKNVILMGKTTQQEVVALEALAHMGTVCPVKLIVENRHLILAEDGVLGLIKNIQDRALKRGWFEPKEYSVIADALRLVPYNTSSTVKSILSAFYHIAEFVNSEKFSTEAKLYEANMLYFCGEAINHLMRLDNDGLEDVFAGGRARAFDFFEALGKNAISGREKSQNANLIISRGLIKLQEKLVSRPFSQETIMEAVEMLVNKKDDTVPKEVISALIFHYLNEVGRQEFLLLKRDGQEDPLWVELWEHLPESLVPKQNILDYVAELYAKKDKRLEFFEKLLELSPESVMQLLTTDYAKNIMIDSAEVWVRVAYLHPIAESHPDIFLQYIDKLNEVYGRHQDFKKLIDFAIKGVSKDFIRLLSHPIIDETVLADICLFLEDLPFDISLDILEKIVANKSVQHAEMLIVRLGSQYRAYLRENDSGNITNETLIKLIRIGKKTDFYYGTFSQEAMDILLGKLEKKKDYSFMVDLVSKYGDMDDFSYCLGLIANEASFKNGNQGTKEMSEFLKKIRVMFETKAKEMPNGKIVLDNNDRKKVKAFLRLRWLPINLRQKLRKFLA